MGFIKGDFVRSTGGMFIKGLVEDVDYSRNGDILSIRWLEHKTKGNIDFVQKHSSSIVRHFC